MTLCANSSRISYMQTGLCRMRTESLVAPSSRSGETVFGGQRRQAPNRLQAAFVPYRDREPANAPAENRGYSANNRQSRLVQECVVVQSSQDGDNYNEPGPLDCPT